MSGKIWTSDEQEIFFSISISQILHRIYYTLYLFMWNLNWNEHPVFHMANPPVHPSSIASSQQPCPIPLLTNHLPSPPLVGLTTSYSLLRRASVYTSLPHSCFIIACFRGLLFFFFRGLLCDRELLEGQDLVLFCLTYPCKLSIRHGVRHTVCAQKVSAPPINA